MKAWVIAIIGILILVFGSYLKDTSHLDNTAISLMIIGGLGIFISIMGTEPK